MTGNTATPIQEMNTYLQTLGQKKDIWASVKANERIAIIDRLLKDFRPLADEWVDINLKSKGYSSEGYTKALEWGAGPYAIVRFLVRLKWSLKDITEGKRPKIAGPIKTLGNGQVSARIFPQDKYDKLFFRGITYEVWMEEGVTPESLPQTQAIPYFDKNPKGKVALVLGSGNVSGIAPTGAISKLFVENQVVILKLNPINEYIGPLIEKGFKALIEPGFLRVAYGGAQEGAYLCNHPLVDEIHITGSDKTFESIVFGSGLEGVKRKEKHSPVLKKPVSGELGNVAPLIVVPGPWNASDIAYQAHSIVSLIADNAGATCHIPRVMIQHASWELKNQLLDQLRAVLSKEEMPFSYYPSSKEKYELFTKAHPEAETYGSPPENKPPWTLITGLNPKNTNDVCFTTESFFGYLGETELEAPDAASFVDRAVEFANNHLWGTLSAIILVHSASLKDEKVGNSVERAVRDLHRGIVTLNYSAGGLWVSGVAPWGAYPGSDIYDIQSGCGHGHNALMFSKIQKTVLRAPFRTNPKPAFFLSGGKTGAKMMPKLVDLELAPSVLKVPGLMLQAMRG